MNIARVVVPIIIAIIVLTLFKKDGSEPKKPTNKATAMDEELLDSYFPLAPGKTWEYTVNGVFEKGKGEEKAHFNRSVLRKRADGSFQLQDSRDGRVIDTYYMSETPKGTMITTMSLDKRKILFLPLSFGPGSFWNLSKRVRATADEDFEEIDIPGIGEKKCIRVRYQRFYDDKQTTRPEWYFEGYRWFCKGLGIVKVDLRDVQQPRPNGKVEYKDTWEIRMLSRVKVPTK